MLDLHRLRLLRELKHRGTLAAVAAALSYSPSAISQQLSLLESEVGVPLLEPAGRRVRLTTQAEILVAHTEYLLERLEMAEADIAGSLAELRGTLRVASFQTAMLTLIPATLTLLRAEHPRLRVEVTQAEPDRALLALPARDHDLVLTEEYPGHPAPRAAELEQEELLDDPMRLALPPGEGEVRDLSELAGRAWIMEPAGTPARRWAVALCRDAGFEPDVRYESTDLLVHLRLVEQGHAVAMVPDLAWVSSGRPTAELRELPGAPVRRILTACRKGSGRHPAIRACRSALSRAGRS